MTEFSGEVKSVIYENAQNMYKILLVAVSQPLAGYDDDEIKVTGTFGDLELGQEDSLTGDLVTHPKYGLQFQATGCQPALPKETGGVVKYLSSDKFPGIGPKTAEKIVDQLGSGGLKSLQADPALIAKLDLSQKQKDSLLSGLAQMDSFDDLAMTLASYGIPRKVAGRLYQKYHDQTLKKLQADPYLPLGEVTGYSFKQADHLGIGFGIALDSLERANGGILAVLLQVPILNYFA